MKRNPWHQLGCMCPLCTPRSPADHAHTAVRARLIIAAVAAAVVLLVCLIVQWRTS